MGGAISGGLVASSARFLEEEISGAFAGGILKSPFTLAGAPLGSAAGGGGGSNCGCDR